MKFVNLCQASIEEQNGRDIMFDPDRWEDSRKHFLEAARLFCQCEKEDRALRCFESIKEYVMAGREFHEYKQRLADYETNTI